ncbi:hypothetical protein [Morganella psychrotolerans]|uniref:Uncharacterized protein n=1 Tax=Morganella psychrotolerans TaxID=368603 RepID=A0A1B8H404_9GAMM|nr:hypothetical protein [Morganella psychrotolerans]OBU03785.1 hypothetical protein AYY17_09455 [Morganella psychrotolerans]
MKSFIFIIFFIFSCSSVYAGNQAELLFHVGAGADKEYRIGGTIENKMASPIEHVAITYLILNEHCYPGNANVITFNQIPGNAKYDFSILVDGPLHGYKILSFTAFDDMGSEYVTEDTTLQIIRERETSRKDTCKKSR